MPDLGNDEMQRRPDRVSTFLLVLLAGILHLTGPVALAQERLIIAAGTVEPNQSVTITARLDATVAEASADIGDRIEIDNALAVLDPTEFQYLLDTARVELAIARARLNADQSNFDRKQILLNKGQASQSVFDEAHRALLESEARVANAQVAVKRAEAMLARTMLLAPISGFVASRSVEVGQTVRSGDPVYRLVDIDRVRIRFFVIERDLSRLRIGAQAEVTVDVIPGVKFTGVVSRLAVAPDAATKTYRAEVSLENKDHRMKPGYSARLVLEAK